MGDIQDESDIFHRRFARSFSVEGLKISARNQLHPYPLNGIASKQKIRYLSPFFPESGLSTILFDSPDVNILSKVSDTQYHANQERRMGLPPCLRIHREQYKPIRLSLSPCHGLLLRDAPKPDDAVTQGLGLTHRNTTVIRRVVHPGIQFRTTDIDKAYTSSEDTPTSPNGAEPLPTIHFNRRIA